MEGCTDIFHSHLHSLSALPAPDTSPMPQLLAHTDPTAILEASSRHQTPPARHEHRFLRRTHGPTSTPDFGIPISFQHHIDLSSASTVISFKPQGQELSQQWHSNYAFHKPSSCNSLSAETLPCTKSKMHKDPQTPMRVRYENHAPYSRTCPERKQGDKATRCCLAPKR